MRKLIYLVVFSMFLIGSCRSEYTSLSTDEFNEKIAGKSQINSPEDLIKEYYLNDKSKIPENLKIDVEELKKGVYIINLLDEDIEHKDVKAVKLIMLAHKIEDTWTVYEIQKSSMCIKEGEEVWTNEICE